MHEHAATAPRAVDNEQRPATQPAHLWTEVELAKRISELEDTLGSLLSRARVLQHPAPRVAGRYVVSRILARGGFGLVLGAEDTHLGREVALKLVPLASPQPELVDRLSREGRALARVDHPCVVRVFDTGVTEIEIGTEHLSCLFVAMERLEGTTLAQWAQMGERAAVATLPLIVRVGYGLAAVHAAKLVHRDVKPQNVIVTPQGRVVLVDFGLARVAGLYDEPQLAPYDSASDPLESPLTRCIGAIGTPEYMAPEVALGAPCSFAADQWSYAAMAWETLTGARPTVAGTTIRCPRWWRIPRPLRAVLRRALSHRAGDRHADIQTLVESLAKWGRERLASRGRLRRCLVYAAIGVFGLVSLPQWGPHARDGIEAMERIVDEAMETATRTNR